jgi:hypothetical protein
MGASNHAHVESAFLSILLTLIVYGAKYTLGFRLPDVIYILPTFMVIFIAFYIILYVIFLFLWYRK